MAIRKQTMNDIALLSTAYLGPVQYYAKLFGYGTVLIEQYEHYVKQTYRNRCYVSSAGGVQALTVPVVKPEKEKCAIKDIRISDHGNWRHLHWNALESAYRNSPFFEYYADDFQPFYTRKYDFLLDFNLELQNVVCKLLDMQPVVKLTEHFVNAGEAAEYDDYRNVIVPGGTYRSDESFRVRDYYQVFQNKLGFQANLSIVDLLFNMGPEGLLILRDSCV